MDNVALLVLQGADPPQACTVLMPLMTEEPPIRLAEQHPETLVSGLRMHEVTKGEGAEPFPLPPAQEGNPGVSESLTVHRCCWRGRSEVYLCHGLSIAALASPGLET